MKGYFKMSFPWLEPLENDRMEKKNQKKNQKPPTQQRAREGVRGGGGGKGLREGEAQRRGAHTKATKTKNEAVWLVSVALGVGVVVVPAPPPPTRAASVPRARSAQGRPRRRSRARVHRGGRVPLGNEENGGLQPRSGGEVASHSVKRVASAGAAAFGFLRGVLPRAFPASSP